MSFGFTPLWQWVMEDKELTQNQALIICRVLRWKDGGCYESNSQIAKCLKMDARTVQRNIKILVKKKQWLAVLYPTRRLRIIYVDPKRLTAGPLFRAMGTSIIKKMTAYNLTEGCGKPVKSNRCHYGMVP